MQKSKFCSDLTIKSAKTDNTIISGYASVFGVADDQNDIITKGAFCSAKSDDVKLLWQHEPNKPIGVITFLKEDEYGLKFEAEINNQIAVGREASALIKQKAICGVSIGFSIKSFDYDAQGMRIINDLRLVEISIVTFPANTQAEIKYVKGNVDHNSQDNMNGLDRLSYLVKKLAKY